MSDGKLWIVGVVHHVGGPFSYYDTRMVEAERELALVSARMVPEGSAFIAPVEVGRWLPPDPCAWEGIEWVNGEPSARSS
jgi:hypothetical protein